MNNMNSKFVLIDLGYPMREKTIRNIINSLENILFLSLALSTSKSETNLNISVLSCDFAIIYFESNSRRKYQTVVESLKDFLNNGGGRVTVQDFKNLLKTSIETVLCEIKKNYGEKSSQVAIVSKKSAWILADILASVTKTLQIPFENFKIVQIIEKKSNVKNTQVDCVFCEDEPNNLNMFFKNWLLNLQKELQILIDEKLEIKCEVEDCVINQTPSQYHLFGTGTQVCRLEIMNRLPLNGLCPTLVFGTPKRVKAINSLDDSRVFKQLCEELNRTGEGLLAKSSNHLSTFHFLTSDGDMILMNDVASNELHLAKGEEFSNCIQPSDNDASVIRDSLKNIKFLHEYKPENFNSGIIELSRQYYDLMEKCKISGEQPHASVSGPPKKEQRKRPKDTHPALLSPQVVNKYRKINKQAFNLPELELDTDFTGCFHTD